MVRLYKDIAEDPFARAHPSGAAALAYRFLGLTSSEDAVTIMILVALFELVAFSITLAVQSYFQARQAQLEAKWSCCTLELPTMKWDLDGFYAAFLSHYKMEAASDARYLVRRGSNLGDAWTSFRSLRVSSPWRHSTIACARWSMRHFFSTPLH
jgi:hypothetical protein